MEVWQIRQVAMKLNELADEIEKDKDEEFYNGYCVNVNIKKIPGFELEGINYDKLIEQTSKTLYFSSYNHFN